MDGGVVVLILVTGCKWLTHVHQFMTDCVFPKRLERPETAVGKSVTHMLKWQWSSYEI